MSILSHDLCQTSTLPKHTEPQSVGFWRAEEKAGNNKEQNHVTSVPCNLINTVIDHRQSKTTRSNT